MGCEKRRAREGQTTFTMTFSLFVALKTLTLLVYFHLGLKDFGDKVEYGMMCEIGPCIMSKLESQSSLHSDNRPSKRNLFLLTILMHATSSSNTSFAPFVLTSEFCYQV